MNCAIVEMSEAQIYAVKRVLYQDFDRKVLLQADNGPCPILAIANSLILRGELALLAEIEDYVDSDSLMRILREWLVATTTGEDPLRQQTLADALSTVPTLTRGLDVNVRFSDCESFEFTRELSVFDAARLRILHGWVVDPNEPISALLSSITYNQAVERAIASPPDGGPLTPSIGLAPVVRQRESDVDLLDLRGSVGRAINDPAGPVAELNDGSASTEGASAMPDASAVPTSFRDSGTAALVSSTSIADWLEATSSQLTFFGLSSLYERVREGEVAVLFRNCHFSTLHKAGGRLYLLVTDVGYAGMPHVVWELLDDVSNDTTLCDAYFRPCDDASAADGDGGSLHHHVPTVPPMGHGAGSLAYPPHGPGFGGPPAMSQPIYQQQLYLAPLPSGVPVATILQQPPAPTAPAAPAWPVHTALASSSTTNMDPDFALALRLQQEEDAPSAAASAHYAPPGHAPGSQPFYQGFGSSNDQAHHSAAASGGSGGAVAGRNDRYAHQAAALRQAALERQARTGRAPPTASSSAGSGGSGHGDAHARSGKRGGGKSDGCVLM